MNIQRCYYCLVLMVTMLNTVWILTTNDFRLLKLEFNHTTRIRKPTATIHIATVVCSAKKGNSKIREEALVMIKSVIISSLMYSVPRITFHILVEHLEDGSYLSSKLSELGYPFKNIEITLVTYRLSTVLPGKFHKLLFHKSFRCMHARFFLPRILAYLDAVLYFDTDTIMLGNIEEFWKLFDKMKGQQSIGVAINRDENCPSQSPLTYGIPHPKPKGLASGIILMNLTLLRNDNWEEKYLRLLADYTELMNKTMMDQHILNILAYYDSRALKLLPCQYNFWEVYCTNSKGMCCTGVTEDPYGVVVLAGSAGAFEPGRTFREIFVAYEKINLTNPRINLKRDLMVPIRNFYSGRKNATHASKSKRKPIKCKGELYKYLFKNHFLPIRQSTMIIK